MSELLKLTVQRDISIFSAQAWQKGYTEYLKEKLDFRYDIIFHYDGEKVRFFHPLSEFNFFKSTVTEKLLADAALFEKLNHDFQNDVRRLEGLEPASYAKNLKKISELVGKIMAFYIFIVSDSFVGRQPAACPSRHMSEGILYLADERIESLLGEALSRQEMDKRLAHFLTTDEAITLLDSGKLAKPESVRNRTKGYVLYEDTLRSDISFADFCSDKNFAIPETPKALTATHVLKGETACPGLACGPAKIIIRKEDLGKLRPGDIMVAIMTNASFTPSLKNVAAIVTDEGGITSHAAIISRENNIPCIMGARIATAAIKDGDIITVDADKGEVTLPEQQSS